MYLAETVPSDDGDDDPELWEGDEDYQNESENSTTSWVDNVESLSHWLLTLNSSCNIAIYLHKDPRFKKVLRDMMLRTLRLKPAHEHHTDGADIDRESRAPGATTALTPTVRLKLIPDGQRRVPKSLTVRRNSDTPSSQSPTSATKNRSTVAADCAEDATPLTNTFIVVERMEAHDGHRGGFDNGDCSEV